MGEYTHIPFVQPDYFLPQFYYIFVGLRTIPLFVYTFNMDDIRILDDTGKPLSDASISFVSGATAIAQVFYVLGNIMANQLVPQEQDISIDGIVLGMKLQETAKQLASQLKGSIIDGNKLEDIVVDSLSIGQNRLAMLIKLVYDNKSEQALGVTTGGTQ